MRNTSRSSREIGLSSAFAGMMSRMWRHQRRQTSVVATAAHRASLSISTYPKRSLVSGSRKMEYVRNAVIDQRVLEFLPDRPVAPLASSPRCRDDGHSKRFTNHTNLWNP